MQPTPDPLALVHEGWDHLKHERPLAACASWQRALRVDPDQPAARQALERLANSPELPASARKEYRFRAPADPDRRSRWDAAFRGRDLSDLNEAVAAFSMLGADDPADADAPYNQGLCLAWLGRNAEAIGCLDRSVRLGAEADFEAAVAAWTLAAVLRQGAGAEDLTDDVRYAVEWDGSPAERLDALARHGRLRRLPPPSEAGRDDVTVAEWLDRPWPEPREGPLRLDEISRVVAIVLASGRGARFSATTPEGIAAMAIETPRGDGLGECCRRIGLPLPLALLDSWVWTIRIPPEVDDESRRRLYRENVEDYFENRWIHRPRRDLGPPWLSPLDAARGEAASRAKLEGTIALFEELADRPTSRELYQGYPFDRLRRRLGLPLRDPVSIDEADPSSMSGDDLDRLDPAALGDHALADAFRSASALGDDARTARFADRAGREGFGPPALTRLDLLRRVRPARPSRARRGPPRRGAPADRRGDRDRPRAKYRGGRDRAASSDLARRHPRPDESSPTTPRPTYRRLLDHSAAAAAVALDGAETLLDNGHDEQGRRLAVPGARRRPPPRRPRRRPAPPTRSSIASRPRRVRHADHLPTEAPPRTVRMADPTKTDVRLPVATEMDRRRPRPGDRAGRGVRGRSDARLDGRAGVAADDRDRTDPLLLAVAQVLLA